VISIDWANTTSAAKQAINIQAMERAPSGKSFSANESDLSKDNILISWKKSWPSALGEYQIFSGT